MAYRVTPEEVKEIFTTDRESEIVPFIRTANVVVNHFLVGKKGLAEPLLKEIELYLAAHFLSLDDRQENFVWIGEARARFGGQFGFGLDFTSHGQQAKILDSSGTLASLGKMAASFTVIGSNLYSRRGRLFSSIG